MMQMVLWVIWLMFGIINGDPRNTVPLSNQCEIQALNNVQQETLANQMTPRDWTRTANKVVTVIQAVDSTNNPISRLYDASKDDDYPISLASLDGTKQRAHAAWKMGFTYMQTKALGYTVEPSQATLDANPCDWPSTFAKYTAINDTSTNTLYGRGSGSFVVTENELHGWYTGGTFKAIILTVLYGPWPHKVVVIKDNDDNFWYLDNNVHNKDSRAATGGYPGGRITNWRRHHPTNWLKFEVTPSNGWNVEQHTLTGTWKQTTQKVAIEYSHKIGNAAALKQWLRQKIGAPDNSRIAGTDGTNVVKTKSGAQWFYVLKTGGNTMTRNQVALTYCQLCYPSTNATARRIACNAAISNTVPIPHDNHHHHDEHYNYSPIENDPTYYLLIIQVLMAVIMLLCFCIVACLCIAAVFGYYYHQKINVNDADYTKYDQV